MKHHLTTYNVSRETLGLARDLYREKTLQYEEYIQQLLWWNDKVNLVSRGVTEEVIREHVIHSLLPSVMNLLDSHNCWVDAGTGGGLPGVPLAVAEPERRWILNDIVNKKIMAVRQIVSGMNLWNISTEAGSLADVRLNDGAVISKHAFPVGDIMAMMEEKPWEKIILYKGADEVYLELSETAGIFYASLYRFDFGETESFYRGKGILVLQSEPIM